MAINYTNLFTVLGKYVKAANSHDGFHTNIDTAYSDIEGILESNTLNRLVRNVEQVMDRAHDDVESWASGLINEVGTVLTDAEFVTDELNNSSSNVQEILATLIEDMNDNSESVNALTTNNGSLTGYDLILSGLSTGSGAGQTKSGPYPVISSLLDGVSSPGQGMAANPEYNNVTSELPVPASAGAGGPYLIAECTSTGGIDQETYSIYSQSRSGGPWGRYDETPPFISGIQNSTALNIIPNGEGQMEEFTNDVPKGWTISGGTAGTDYKKYNVGFRGNHSLQVLSDGVTLTKILDNVEPGRLYSLLFRWQEVTTTKGGSDYDEYGYTISGQKLDGTSWSVTDTGVQYARPQVGWQPVWPTVHIPFVTPNNLANNRITISLTFETFYASDSNTYDWFTVAPGTFYNGQAWWIIPGTLDDLPQVGDKTGPDELLQNGYSDAVFQYFFKRAFGVQLPSNSAGSETINDSLAT